MHLLGIYLQKVMLVRFRVVYGAMKPVMLIYANGNVIGGHLGSYSYSSHMCGNDRYLSIVAYSSAV